MSFVLESAGNRASRVRMGRHEMLFDMPPEMGGDGRAPGPLAVFVAATAACMHYFASGVLKRNDLPVENLRVKVYAHQTDEGPVRLDQLKLEVMLPPEISSEVAALVEAAVKKCPVHGTLTSPPPIEVSVTRSSAG